MHAPLSPGRWGLAASPQRVRLAGPAGAGYSMEVAPNGRIHFSDGGGIYRLVRA
jgi:hypothetical protein